MRQTHRVDGGVIKSTVEHLLRHSDQLLWLLDAQSLTCVGASNSHVEILGLRPEFAYDDFFALFCDAGQERVREALGELVEGGAWAGEARLKHAAGHSVPVRLQAFRSPASPGSPISVLGHVAGRTEDLFHLLAQNFPGTVYLCRNDAQYSMLFISEGITDLTGWSRDDFLLGTVDFPKIFHPEDAERIGQTAETAISERRPYRINYRLYHRNGELRHVHEVGCGVWDARGELAYLIGTLSDITERVHAEQAHDRLQGRLKQGERLETVGRLAGGIAHDLNNLLQVIVGNLELAKLVATDSKQDEYLSQAVTASEAASDMVESMLTFAGRKPAGHFQVLDVAELWRSTARLVATGAVPVNLSRPDDPHPVYGDRVQLQQVVMNLIVNGVQAVEAAGSGEVKIRLSTAPTLPTGAQVSVISQRVASGPFTVLEVADEGTGIRPEHLEQIFESWFTTKDEGHGLGLYTVKEGVDAHGGALTLSTEFGKGTTVRVYLPLHTRPAVRPSRACRPTCLLWMMKRRSSESLSRVSPCTTMKSRSQRTGEKGWRSLRIQNPTLWSLTSICPSLMDMV